MAQLIQGLHHVTSKSSDPRQTDGFWRNVLGLRRIKQTVNFDNPKVYHLYYGNEIGQPGTVMTYFPFPGLAKGNRGTGEVASCALSVPTGSLDYWEAHLGRANVQGLLRTNWFDAESLEFQAPDGDEFRLVEIKDDSRQPYLGCGHHTGAIRGFDGVTLCLDDIGQTSEILQFFGYQQVATSGETTRFQLARHNGAGTIDLKLSNLPRSAEGAGSVHHVAFAVQDRAAQTIVRDQLLAQGNRVTHVFDRDYFFAIYFRTDAGVLFEVATYEPGFAADEAPDQLGQQLKLPTQHEHLRGVLTQDLNALD